MKLPKKVVALDTETTGLNPYRPDVHATHISWWSWHGGGVLNTKDGRFSPVIEVAQNREILKVFFNAPFDIPILRKAGVSIRGPVIDVGIMARMCWPDEPQHTLKHFARKFNDDAYLEEVTLKKYLRKHKIDVRKRGYGDVPDHIIHPYTLKDAEMTYQLYHTLSVDMDELGLWPVLQREMKLMPTVMAMAERGIQVDRELAEQLLLETRAEMATLKETIVKETGNPAFNPNSPAQIVAHLYGSEDDPKRAITRYTKGAKPSSDKTALLTIGDDFCKSLLTWRRLDKSAGTYLTNTLGAIDDEGTLRISFNQAGARTGRFSSSGYDVRGQIQNIPRAGGDGVLGRIREIYSSRPGYRLACLDFDQIEARLAAHFSKDQHELSTIRRGDDLHSLTCQRVFSKSPGSNDFKLWRYLAKTVRYLMIYCGGPEKLIETVYEDTNGEVLLKYRQAERIIEDYKEAHPPLMALRQALAEEVENKGGIRNPFGRYVAVNPHKSYTAVNYLIQGTAADLIKLKMMDCAERLKGTKSHLLLQVHDELVFEIHQDDGIKLVWELADLMEDHTTFSVPMTVSVSLGKRWGVKKTLQRHLICGTGMSSSNGSTPKA